MFKEKIQNDLKEALKGGEKIVLSVLRMVLSEAKNEEIKKGLELSDDDWVNLFMRQIKMRRQSIVEFEKASRQELADKENEEIKIIQRYLPETLSDEELDKIVEDVISSLQASSMQDMGKVMSTVMGQVKGRVEGGKVSSLVKQKLSNI